MPVDHLRHCSAWSESLLEVSMFAFAPPAVKEYFCFAHLVSLPMPMPSSKENSVHTEYHRWEFSSD